MEPVSTDLCPSCNAALPETGKFPMWCPACNWNVEAEHSIVEWKYSAFNRLVFRIRARHSAQRYEELIAREPHSLRPRLTAGKVATYAIAAAVNLIPFALAALAISMIYANWPSISAMVWGAIILFAAWALLPAKDQMPKNLLSRERAPRLYQLVDKVAAANGARPVHSLVVEAEFGASYQEVGLLRRPIVTIGLPLWAVLNPQERIAILSHEFAHGTNRDSITHGFVARAIQTLARLADTLAPSYDDFFSLIMSPVLAVLSGIFRGLAMLMLELFWQRSQDAEFRADYSASRVAGSEAMQHALRKTSFSAYLTQVLDPVSYRDDWQGKSIFPEFKAFVASLPPIELERLRRADELQTFEKKSSHPPRWARVRFLQRHASQPSLVADADEMALIDKELARLEPVITSRLLALYYPDK